MNRSIGCNIVHPECDRAEMYTREVYIERLSAYRRYGVRHVEFSHVTAIDETDARAIREHAMRIGVAPWSIHSEHLNDAGRAALDAYMGVQLHCARVARELGASVFVCHIPNLPPYANDIGRDMEILNHLADITESHGLKLAIETGPPTDYVIELVNRIGRPTVGINLDTGHTVLAKEDPARAAWRIGKHLFTTHLQDNFGLNDDHQPPGMGIIDWRSVLRALAEIGYEGPLMVELTGEGVKANRSVVELRSFPLEKELVFALAYLEHLLSELFP